MSETPRLSRIDCDIELHLLHCYILGLMSALAWEQIRLGAELLETLPR